MKHLLLILIFCTITSPAYSAAVVLQPVKDAQGRDRFETRYRLTPKPLEQPHLKYSLYWDYAERQSGNAALYYELAYSEMLQADFRRTRENVSELLTKIWDKAVDNPPLDKAFLVEITIPFAIMKDSEEKRNFTSGHYMNVWNYTQPAYYEKFESHLDEMREIVEQYSEVFRLMERGSRCDYYDLGISYRESDVPSELLPPLQNLRALARLLQAKIWLEIYEGKYEDAVKSIRVGMEMAKHIGDQPTLLCPLVGIAIHGIMHSCLMELLDRPDSPNLYWAVTNRPNPYFNFAQSVGAEKAMLYQMFPLLKKATADPDSLSDEEWRLLCQQADNMIQEQMEGEMPDISVETAYPDAREWLAQQGKSEAEIDTISKEKAVGLQMGHDIQIVWGDSFNAIYLPIWERVPDLEENVPLFFQENFAYTSPYGRFIGLQFAPAIEAGKNAFRRVQLQNDTLRISLALRIYMAENSGKLPETLSEIKSVPVPMIDPYTGKAFRYRLENGVGIIEVPEHTYPLTVYFEP